MKILCICYEDLSGYSGSNRQVIELVKNLQKLGHEIQICAPLIGKSKELGSFKINYIPVINLPILRYLSYLLLSPWYFIIFFIKFKPDAAFIFEIYLDFGPLLAAKTIMHCPFAFYVNGIAAEEFRLAKIPRVLIWFIEAVQRIYSKIADIIFVVTPGLKNDLHERYRIPLDKIMIVRDAVDTDDFKPMDRDFARERLGFEKNLNIIGFVGSLQPWHGADYLIESIPLILKEISNVKVVIVGQGRMSQHLLRKREFLKLEDTVIFTGLKPFKEVPIYINAFDVCVVFFKPVRTDPGDPIKLYEYLACAKPVVASNVCGYGDFTENVGAGISVDASNREVVAGAIIKLLKDEPLRREMGSRGKAAVEREHTWLKRAVEVERFLGRIKSKRSLT